MNIQYQADCFKVIYQMLCKFTKISVRCDPGGARQLFRIYHPGNALYDLSEICRNAGGQVHPGLVEEFLKTADHCGDHSAGHALPAGAAGNYFRKRAASCHQQCVRICSMACNADLGRGYAIYRNDGDALGVPAHGPVGSCGSGV